ncbi:MAG: response regulator [Candidatus Omnitrophica bacterium]|nr:response regulator [Candidatus Omnitrophota bacterium]
MALLKKRYEAIKTIGLFLALLYVTSLSLCILYSRNEHFFIYGTVLSFLLALLFVAALGVCQKSEMARKIIVVGNIILGIYLLMLVFRFPDLISLTYILGAFIFAGYFSLSDVKLHFRSKNRQWQSILVVDDDEVLIRTIRPVLTAQGYLVLTANRGEDGIHIAKHQKPDLILLDVILPGIKGRDVCKRLKEDPETKSIPVIFLTSKNSQDDIEAEMKAGAEAHLTKPVNAETLIVTIQGILNR